MAGGVFTAGRVQLGFMKNWGMLGAADAGMYFSIALFMAIFALSFLSPRFWCRYVCPSGALLSFFGLLSTSRRNVTAKCTKCGQCARHCPFDAVDADFSTRQINCAFCRTCGAVCPVGAIEFTWSVKVAAAGQVNESEEMSRRGLVLAGIGGALAAAGTKWIGARGDLLRPPGSVAEREFLRLCVRCGECFKVCPGSVLQPAGLGAGLDALWTPVAVPMHAGCHQDCNFCTLICPTRAIRPLSIAEKRRTRMGLAIIDSELCLPHRGERDCQLCFDECEAAAYHAIQMRPIKLKIGDVPEGAISQEQLEEMSRINAPFIDNSRCIGCGLCEYRCHSALVRQQKLLPRRAVHIAPIER